MRIVAEARKNFRFVANFHVQRIDEQDVALLAHVYAALEDAVIQQVIRWNIQPLDDGALDVALGVADGQFDFGQAQHTIQL